MLAARIMSLSVVFIIWGNTQNSVLCQLIILNEYVKDTCVLHSKCQHMNYDKINTDYILLSNGKKNNCNQITSIKGAKETSLYFHEAG